MTDPQTPRPSTSTPSRTPSAVDAVAEAWVDTLCELAPETKVWLGRPEHEGRYGDLSPAGAEALADAARTALATLERTPPVDAVDDTTRTDLARELSLVVEQVEAGTHLDDVNVIASPGQSVRELLDLMPTESEQDWADVAARVARVPEALAGHVASLREGMARGRTVARRQVEATAAQLEANVGPAGFFATFVAGAPAELPDSLRRDLSVAASAASDAYAALVDVYRTEVLAHAREADGVGRERYELASRQFLGATIDLDETYEWGLEELARMVEEQERVAREIVPGGTVQDAVAHLDADPARRIVGTDALQRWMQRTSDRAVEELGRTHFDIPEPVRRLECRIAPSSTGIIYYTGPSDDFSRPGRMWWSVPDGVTEFATWRELTTVYHEGVPGHHLQIGQATYNRAELNTWRRVLAGTSGHAEGWALYAERLMERLGYLDDPADRLGMLDGQRMRAARVVLDIGVHLGKPRPDGEGVWDGDHALEFFRRHVNMNDEFVKFEVNRYLGWPGQAPSYKVGQRIWEQLRDAVALREGAAFDIKEFHRRALDLGGVGLDTLRHALLT